MHRLPCIYRHLVLQFRNHKQVPRINRTDIWMEGGYQGGNLACRSVLDHITIIVKPCSSALQLRKAKKKWRRPYLGKLKWWSNKFVEYGWKKILHPNVCKDLLCATPNIIISVVFLQSLLKWWKYLHQWFYRVWMKHHYSSICMYIYPKF